MKNIIIQNRRGGSLTNWVMVVGIMLLFIVVLQTQIFDPMNDTYNKTFETGLNTSSLNDLQSLKETSQSTIEGAEAEATSDGLTLKDSWTVGKGTFKMLGSFIGGSFISTVLTDILDLPEVVANTLIVLIWLSLIMIIIYIFMKVIP